MAIYGIVGGIGTGKTLTGVSLMLDDLYKNKKIFTNTKLKNYDKKLTPLITYLTKDAVVTIFDKVKEGVFDMTNSTVFIQEMHNYLDSRRSMTQKNRVFTYWILQSRHTGMGSCSIIYDTQDIGQIDIRLRRNTDFLLRPLISQWEIIKGVRTPKTISVMGETLLGHKMARFNFIIDCETSREMYNTFEIIDF